MHELMGRLRATLHRRYDVIGVGECSLDEVLCLPPGTSLRGLAGGKAAARARVLLGGGQIATAMVACQRLGLRAAFYGAVGDDAAGEGVLRELQQEGVAAADVHRCPAAQTRSALILVDAAGERTVVEWHDPALRLPAGYPPAAAVAAARVVHLDGTYPSAALPAAATARRGGALVSIDLDQVGEGSAELVALADLCVVSAGFPEQLTGEPQRDGAALALAGRTGGLVVVTLGAEGCLAVERAADGRPLGVRLVPAFTPPAMVDTTACGDTFHAALIAALIEQALTPPAPEDADAALAAALRFACAAAALKCQAFGRRGCPERAAVARFLQAQGA